MKPIRCVIVDDEPLAREGLAGYVAQLDFLDLVASCSNPIELSALLEKTQVDLIFLDIQMSLMSGIDFLRIRTTRPMVILTTAYPQYALESYQLDVLDYLVKPITFDRFFKAVSKARDYHALMRPAQVQSEPIAAADYFFIRCDHQYEKIFYSEILFIEGLQNYVALQTSKKKHLTLLSLKHLEANLPKDQFIRVHKSFIIAKNQVDSFQPHELRIGEFRIPVGRMFRDEVVKRIVDDKLWKNT